MVFCRKSENERDLEKQKLHKRPTLDEGQPVGLGKTKKRLSLTPHLPVEESIERKGSALKSTTLSELKMK